MLHYYIDTLLYFYIVTNELNAKITQLHSNTDTEPYYYLKLLHQYNFTMLTFYAISSLKCHIFTLLLLHCYTFSYHTKDTIPIKVKRGEKKRTYQTFHRLKNCRRHEHWAVVEIIQSVTLGWSTTLALTQKEKENSNLEQ